MASNMIQNIVARNTPPTSAVAAAASTRLTSGLKQNSSGDSNFQAPEETKGSIVNTKDTPTSSPGAGSNGNVTAANNANTGDKLANALEQLKTQVGQTLATTPIKSGSIAVNNDQLTNKQTVQGTNIDAANQKAQDFVNQQSKS